MSAAAPGVPPHTSNLPNPSNGNTVHGAKRERVFAHIQDLQLQAQTGYDSLSSIRVLLDHAEHSFNAAQGHLSFRRPDHAFVDYTRAYALVTQVIPDHKGWVDFIHDDKNGEQKFKVLTRKVNSFYDQFMNIKEIIKSDNSRHGTRPAMEKTGNGHIRSTTLPTNGYVSGNVSAGKPRPSPSPKPDALHGRALSTVESQQANSKQSLSSDILRDRFSKLRLNTVSPVGSSQESLNSATSIQATPLGFAGSTSNGVPIRPAKLPLDTHNLAGLPRPPSPTYSPARNMDTNGSIAPPRHTARSLASSDVRRTSMQTPQSATGVRTPAAETNGGYFPPSVDGAILGSAPRRRRSTHLDELKISAERLYDYLQRFSVLLIDLRTREEFDQGHIFTRNIMCIEPMSLRQGMSAEELYETLIISPEPEQAFWDDRNKFDLIVYYDQDTQSETYLNRPRTEHESSLKSLHEALWDFNQEKPLKAAPKLLAGGLDAWCDIAGSQSLATSNTVGRRTQLQRRPLATTSSSRTELRVPKRRLRDYNPLDKDEERTWLERARQESVSAPKPPVLTEEVEGAEDIAEDDADSGNAAIEAFLERFPDAGMIDRQPGFMSRQMPARVPPPPPAKIPEYPARPVSSQQPRIPTRPMPAAPRMSYNGVSDRAAPPLPRTSSSMAPYIPPKYNPMSAKLPRTGLVNFGVTCYMNSTLQALSATIPLSVFFLDDNFRKSIQQDNWKGSKGVMPELYSTVIRSLWSGDVESIKPTTFRNFCGRLNREWTIDRQQDAKEFFDFLVDCLHEDLNPYWSLQPAKALTEAEEQRREAMPKGIVSRIEWKRYTDHEHSELTKFFGGQHASKLRCTTCGFTSTTYEAFYSISVEIPKPKTNSGRISLDECLRSYCAEEMLSGDEVWKCPHCRREREATKQITLTRAPQFLVVHFKRFAAGHSTSARKVRTPIDFPLQGLDLEPYMLPEPTVEDFQQHSRTLEQQKVRPDLGTRPPYIYDAYAVVRHIGTTLASGHYTCAVKDRVKGVWRMFNDTRVNDFEPAQLRPSVALNNEEAYIVFYSRRV